MKINFKKLDPKAVEPTRAREGDAGYDVCALEATTLEPGEYKVVPTGIALEIPDGVEVQVRPRSGLAAKHGISVVNAPGTLDSGYRGDIGVILINLGTETFEVEQGMPLKDWICQTKMCCSIQKGKRFGGSIELPPWQTWILCRSTSNMS